MAIRNIEEIGLDEITQEFLLDEAIDLGMDLGVDTNQGSLYRDAADGHIIRTAKFFNDLNQVNTVISIYTCTGDVLDEKLAERGLTRSPAADTSAVYYVDFVGAEPEEGDTVTVDGHFFTVIKIDDQWAIESEETGTDMNTLVPGTPVIPETDVDGLTSATLGFLAVPAVDMEDDDSARTRLLTKISGPSENANKTQVESWCEDIDGVGRARIISLWAGDNTVLAVLISSDGTVPTDAVVAQVQEIIDPGAEGMGEGLATIGCHFTARAAVGVEINISASILKDEGTAIDTIESEIAEAVAGYLKEMALSSETEITVRYARIGALISGLDGVIDYDNLLVNGDTNNIECTIYEVPIVGEVTVSADL